LFGIISAVINLPIIEKPAARAGGGVTGKAGA
jgi:hypothetical protein